MAPSLRGALLRREGLCSSHLILAPGGRGQRTGRARPEAVRLAKAESRRVEALQRKVTRLRQELGRAEQIEQFIEAQKNSANCWGCPWARSPRGEHRHGGRRREAQGAVDSAPVRWVQCSLIGRIFKLIEK